MEKQQDATPSGVKARVSFETIAAWVGLLGGLMGLAGGGTGLFSFFESRKRERVTRTVEVERLLTKAMDALGGEEGSDGFVFGALTPSPAQQERAWRAIREAEKLDPDNMMVLRATCLIHGMSGAYELAEVCNRTLLQRAPGDPRNIGNLAGVLMARGKTEEALQEVRRAIQLAPAETGLYVTEITGLQRLGRLEEALIVAQKAVKLDQRNAALRVKLGQVLLALGRYEEAELALREAIRLGLRGSSGYAGLGVALASQGKAKASVDAFAEAISAQSRPDTVFDSLYEPYAKHGKSNAVIETLRLAAADSRTAPHAQLALCYQLGASAGPPSEVADACRKAIALMPTGRAYVALGLALARQGNTEEAVGALRTGLASDSRKGPDRQLAEEVLKALEAKLAGPPASETPGKPPHGDIPGPQG